MLRNLFTDAQSKSLKKKKKLNQKLKNKLLFIYWAQSEVGDHRCRSLDQFLFETDPAKPVLLFLLLLLEHPHPHASSGSPCAHRHLHRPGGAFSSPGQEQ